MPGGHEHAQQSQGPQPAQEQATSPDIDPQGQAAQGQSQELQNPEAQLVDVFVSFGLASGTVLNSTFTRELRTTHPTRVVIKASREKLHIYTTRALHIDAMWPAQNMRFYGVTLDFATGALDADVRLIGGMGEGFLDYSDNARTEFSNLVRNGIQGTPMGRPGYDPFNDPNLRQTVQAIKANFQNQPSNGEGGVQQEEMERLAAGATIRMVTPFSHVDGSGAGLMVDAGSEFQIRAEGTGSVADVAAAQGPQGKAEAAQFQRVDVSQGEFRIVKDGETVVIIESLTVRPGGQASIGRFQLAGSARRAADTESLFRFLGTAASLASHGVPGEAALNMAAHSPGNEAEIVPGLARNRIEAALSQAVQTLLQDNAQAIPGLDLSRIFN